jgi:glycine oxidase
VKSYDAIIIGGGIIGISLAIELGHRRMKVLVLERGEPGKEASTAGAGMLAAGEVEGPDALCVLAHMSAEMYPEWVAESERASGLSVDFHREGAVCLSAERPRTPAAVPAEQVAQLEPELAGSSLFASFSAENSVDPLTLMPALLAWAKREGVEVHSGSEVKSLSVHHGIAHGVVTRQTDFTAKFVVNCAGAWAGAISSDVAIPCRPVKGHMLALLPQKLHGLRHVIRRRDADVYLVPRRDGRIVVGSTVEEAGFDKRVDTRVIQKLHQAASDIIPGLGEARIHEAWTGLRPATPDGCPIMGATTIGNYFVSTGHYRNGILLAPASARMLAGIINGEMPTAGFSTFSVQRFAPGR